MLDSNKAIINVMHQHLNSISKADILVVDDMPDNIRLISKMLMEQGYTVRKAISGQIALTAVQSLPPDLILLDINMPMLDGYEVCKILKNNPLTRFIPVIFLSALDEILDKIQAFQVGAVDYITKPFQFEEVLARVQTQLTIRNLQTQLQIQNSQLEQALNQLKTTQRFAVLSSDDALSQAQGKPLESSSGSRAPAQNQVQQEKPVAHDHPAPIVTHLADELSSISCDEINSARQQIQDLLKLLNLYQQEYPNPTPRIQEAIRLMNLNCLISTISAGATFHSETTELYQ